jgi:NTE family protein
LRWQALGFDETGIAQHFVPQIVQPIRRLAGTTIDWKAVLRGLLSTESIAEKVAGAYRTCLYGDATLQDLPDDAAGAGPRFVINASSVQSGVLWRFSRPYTWDYRVGRIDRPTLPLATAVASSSAFPPFLSPMTLRLRNEDYVKGSGTDLQRPPFTTRPTLTDGGVYDNLGLETAWKRYRTILVSDGGAALPVQGKAHHDWPRHVYRVLAMIDNQVGSLRKRQVIAAYQLPHDEGPTWRDGTYWGVRTDIRDYELADPLPCPHAATLKLAEEPTRLAALSNATQERLINWGYAVCDAAMRRWVVPGAARPPAFPYPAAGVG